MSITTLSLLVKGTEHRNKRGPGRRFEIAMCSPGEPVMLEHEPENPADPHAVRIMSARGIQIGYVAADRAPWIGAKMRNADVRAVFQRATPSAVLIRVTLDGSYPQLPAEPEYTANRLDSIDDVGFYPDPIWPED